MALLRIEPTKDEESGLYYLQVFNPPEATVPIVTTEARYMTAAAAEQDLIATLAAAASRPRRD